MTEQEEIKARAVAMIERRNALLSTEDCDTFCFSCWHHHASKCRSLDRFGLCGCDTPLYRDYPTAQIRNRDVA